MWYKYDLATNKFTKQSGEPADQTERRVVLSEDGKQVVWIEDRDGKATLFVSDADGSDQKTLASLGALQYPVRWLGSQYVIFRVRNSEESADYVVALAGGDAQKVADVFDQVYYGRYY
ncbi:hypothetical protein HY346_02475 [Candidatus Microgenomates bacterium]|nr:hypothetical protein [Candidatus Microgenomates bacterium]